MGESKHTPGPWELVSLSGYGAPFSIRMAYHSDNPNAPKTHYGIQSVRRREDAYLIAAAPEMLEALKAIGAPDLVDLVSLPEPVVRGMLNAAVSVAQDAIAKAEGR